MALRRVNFFDTICFSCQQIDVRRGGEIWKIILVQCNFRKCILSKIHGTSPEPMPAFSISRTMARMTLDKVT